MGTKTQGEDVDLATEAVLEASLEAAFSAGFKDEDYVMPEEAGPATPSATSVNDEAQADVVAKKPRVNEGDTLLAVPSGEPVVNEGGDPSAKEWEGVSDGIRQRFENMSSELERVTNIANSASGRANKLQSQVQQSLSRPAETPKPTSQQIHEAMVDKAKRDVLRDDFPDFAAAFDELDSTISNAVGSQIDALRSEFTTRQKQTDAEQVKYTLDMRHPGWENTVQDVKFKDWIYAGGPGLDERTEYENTLGYAQSLSNNSPSESEALFTRANDLYATMLSKYPTWASDRGSLFGDPSGNAAIKLLDMHKALRDQQAQTDSTVNDEHASQQARNRQRLANNIAPTSGASKQPVVDAAEDAEAAFKAGFNS